MIERLGLATVPDFEAALRDLGAAVDLPSTPDLARVVGARLRATPRPAVAPVAIRQPTPSWQRLPLLRSVPRSLLLAAAITMLIVGIALGVRFGLDLLEIDFGPLPTTSSSPLASGGATSDSGHAGGVASSNDPAGARLGLGLAASLKEVSAEAHVQVMVPEVLGPPDDIFAGGSALRGQVAFLYRPRPDLPASDLLAGAGLLVTQSRGAFDQALAGKLAASGATTVEPVDVAGAPGYWLAGAPHMFWYLAPDGTPIEESQRQVGDTLAWERNGVLYRIEGAISKERALEIARSMRAP